jgi:glycosyltransferase involved in cell wall biosynthesis
MKILIVGPAYPFRGGIADTNEALCRAIIRNNHESAIITFSLQYPNFLFPGKTQYTNDPAPTSFKTYQWINSINPLSWIQVARKINKMKPDLVVLRYWLPFMAPALGSIARMLHKKIKKIAITDNIIPHEKRPGDKLLTNYFTGACHGFITLSSSVKKELESFTRRPVMYFPHPINDNLGKKTDKKTAKQHLGLDENTNYLLFFGIIRKYKGLDLLLQAIAHNKLQDLNFKLLIVGEFYDDPKPYYDMIQKLGLENRVIINNEFVPTEEIKYYFSAADLVTQTYHTASQSGISQIAYNFENPMLVTNVGGLSEIIPHGKVGYVVEKDPAEIAEAILDYYQNDKQAMFAKNMKEEKKKYSWDLFAEKMISFYQNL